MLVVEDSELNRLVAVALLDEKGLTVETAENGKIAVEKVTTSTKGAYEAVFMDIQMPVMDGYEATRCIREWESGIQESKLAADDIDLSSDGEQMRLPIIALTAHAMKGEKDNCMTAGMDDYLSKPIDEQLLNHILYKWIGPGRDRNS